MIYIAHTHLNPKHTVAAALQALSGLGRHQSLQMCDQLGVSPRLRIGQLDPTHLENAAQLILHNYDTGRERRRVVEGHVARLVKIACYRGFRHVEGLPVRGQRTHGNSRTVRRRRLAATRTSL
jgi:small subunit ribosomal protein S13